MYRSLEVDVKLSVKKCIDTDPKSAHLWARCHSAYPQTSSEAKQGLSRDEASLAGVKYHLYKILYSKISKFLEFLGS